MQFANDKYKKFLKHCLYPCVRIRAKKAGGSGQVIYSNEESGTFVLSCSHVISSAIEVKKEWSSVLQEDVKKDVCSDVTVEFFKYDYDDKAKGSEAVKAEIVSYDKNEDIALLRLKESGKREHVADIMETDDPGKNLNYFDEVITIGAALGHPPVSTVGNINSFNDIIKNRDYMLSSAPSIYGNCLTGDSLVSMADGTVKEIKDIEEGDTVLSYGEISGKMSKQSTVDEVINSGKKEIYKLKTRNRTIRLSGNHPIVKVEQVKDFAGRNRNVPKWAQVDDIEEDDVIAIMQSHIPRQKTKGFYFAKEIGQDKDPLEFMQFLGFFVGDGYKRDRSDVGQGGELQLYPYSKDLTKKYKSILENLFDVNVTIVSDYEELRVSSIELVKNLSKWGFDGLSKTKSIPDWVMRANYDWKMAFLKGYLDADGYENKHGAWVFEAANKKLMQQLRMMCIHMGLHVSNICYRKRKSPFDGSDFETWNFQVYPEYSKGRNSTIYGDKSLLPDNLDFVKVTNIEPDGEEETYDIKLNTRHTFFSDGILVHNSGGATFLTKNWKLVGMPARISVSISGYSADPITHLGYTIPFWRINKFFKDHLLEFLYDEDKTYADYQEKIEEKRKKSKLDRLIEGEK